MPIIVSHQSNQAISNASGGQSTPSQNAEAFLSQGQSMAKGMETLSKGVNHLGNVLFDAEVEKRQEIQSISLIEDMQNLQLESQQWTDTYTQENRGKLAVNAEKDSTAFYNEKLDALKNKWAGNKKALEFIQRNGGNLSVNGINSMRSFANKEHEAWKDSVFEGEKATYNSTISNPNTSYAEVNSASQQFSDTYTVYLKSKGLDDTATKVEVENTYRKAQKERLSNSFIECLNNGYLDKAEATLDLLKNGDGASFASVYESGVLGSRAIGYDKKGGTSYGKFQISSKAGTFDSWLTWLDKNGYNNVSNQLRSAGSADTGSNQGKMPEVWSALVDSGEITDEMQTQFIQESHLDPALARLPKEIQDNILSDSKLYRAFFSTAVQHGSNGTVKLFTESWEQAKGNKDAFLSTLYEKRAKSFQGSTPEVQASVKSRLEREFKDLDMFKSSPETIAKYTTALEKAKTAKLTKDSLDLYSNLPTHQAIEFAMSDPKLKENSQAQHSVVNQLHFISTQKENIAKAERLQQLSDAYASIDDAVKNNSIPEINKIILASPPEDQAKLQAYANRILHGDGLVSDPVSFDELVDRISTGENVNIEAEYADKLNLQDLRKAKGMLTRRDLAQYRVQEKVAFEEEALKYNKDFTKTEISTLFKRFEASIPDGKFNDTQSRKRALNEFFRPIVLTEKGRLWGENQSTYRGYEEKTMSEQGLIPTGEKYQELKAMLKEQLNKRGEDREPTREEISRLYKAILAQRGW